MEPFILFRRCVVFGNVRSNLSVFDFSCPIYRFICDIIRVNTQTGLSLSTLRHRRSFYLTLFMVCLTQLVIFDLLFPLNKVVRLMSHDTFDFASR